MTAKGRFDPFAKPSENSRYLRIAGIHLAVCSVARPKTARHVLLEKGFV